MENTIQYSQAQLHGPITVHLVPQRARKGQLMSATQQKQQQGQQHKGVDKPLLQI